MPTSRHVGEIDVTPGDGQGTDERFARAFEARFRNVASLDLPGLDEGELLHAVDGTKGSELRQTRHLRLRS